MSKKYLKNRVNIFVICVSITLSSCSGNILSGTANKTSDEALLFDIRELNNKGSYTEALSKFSQLTAETRAARETQFLLSKVYGGLCGFTFLDFITVLSEVATSGKTFFKLLMDSAPGSTSTQIDYCILSEETITAYAPSVTDRNEDENLFLFLIEMYKMAKILNTHFDTNDDGVTDSVDACSTTVLPNTTAQPYIQHMVTGMTLMTTSAAGISSTTVSDATSALSSACADATTAGFSICDTSDPTAVTTDQQGVMRSLIKESSSIGVGVNCTGDITVCKCPPL